VVERIFRRDRFFVADQACSTLTVQGSLASHFATQWLLLVLADIVVEAMLMRARDRLGTIPDVLLVEAAKVPLSDMGRGVAGRLEQIGQRHGRGRQMRLVVGKVLADVEPQWVAPGEHACPGGSANGRARVELGELDAAAGQPIEVGRGHRLAAKTRRIGVAHVVRQEKHEVRSVVFFKLFSTSRFGDRAREHQQSEHNGKTYGSWHTVLSWRSGGMCVRAPLRE
jgi:hypothetical protein